MTWRPLPVANVASIHRRQLSAGRTTVAVGALVLVTAAVGFMAAVADTPSDWWYSQLRAS